MTKLPCGPLLQVAYIVDDLDSGIDYWTKTMGVGPFFVFPPLDAMRGDYRGHDHVVQIGAAMAYSGDLMVELIEPRGPSIFQEFADRGRGGVHHLCAFGDDMTAIQADLEGRGGKRIQGTTYGDGSEIAYFAMDEDESVILEIAVARPEVIELFAAIKAAGAAWDGEQRRVSF